jgi:predicted ATPase
LPPLARLIAQASARTQLIVVSHAAPLLSALADVAQLKRIVLHKELGETLIEAEGTPSWTWPTR